MLNSNEIAEMVNNTNYASMSYGELVTLNFAFLLAIGEIKPLMTVKRAEEMDAHTDEYVAKMNSYGASRAEILACLEKKVLRDQPFGSPAPQDVDDQTPTVVAENNPDKGEEVLALPSPNANTTDEIDLYEYWESLAKGAPEEDENVQDEENDHLESDSSENSDTLASDETSALETKEQTIVEEAIETMKSFPLPEDVNSVAPYYIDCVFRYGDNGEIGHSNPSGRNLGTSDDLEEFRTATEKFMRIFKKKNIITSTNDCLVYLDGKNTYSVRLYHFPEEKGDDAELPAQETKTVGEEDVKVLKKKNALMKKAIKMAKERSYSDGKDVHTPFYDKYVFTRRINNKLELRQEQVRVYEDVSSLAELMPAFESYARLFNDNYVVLSKDNCVAAMTNASIYLLLFNIPAQEGKKKRTTKRSKPVAEDIQKPEESMPITSTSPALGENDLILQAVEMTKALPLYKRTDKDATYFIQCDFSITDNGELIPGRTFSTNVDSIDYYRAVHQKCARKFMATQVSFAEDYTAYIWSGNKTLSVFYYNVKDNVSTAA